MEFVLQIRKEANSEKKVTEKKTETPKRNRRTKGLLVQDEPLKMEGHQKREEEDLIS